MVNRFVIVLGLLNSLSMVAIAQTKLPVPSQGKQTEAERLVRDIFKSDYSKAKKPAEKLALAQKLLEQGLATKDDPAGRYVLLRDARDLAVDVGSVGVSLDAIEAVSEQFELDSKKLIVEHLVKAAKVTKPVGGNKQDLVRVMAIIEEAVEADDFEYAMGLASVASFIAKNVGAESRKIVTVRVAEIESIQKAFEAVRVARQKLATAADNPEANLIDGKYLCFLKGDWDTGLARLANCSDLSLKTLAEKDLANPTMASDEVSVGDGWWSLADKEEGLAKARLALRAKEWYSRSEKGLTGLTAAKVKKRFAEVEALLEGTSLSLVSGASPVPLAIAPFNPVMAMKHQEAWAKNLKQPVTIENSIGMKLKLIPPGEFMMGSPETEAGREPDETQHQVRLTKPFYMGLYEVTQEQYERVMGTNPSTFKGAKNPVEQVSWNDAEAFCRKLTALPAEQQAGGVYRLPTEAEWEYACRAGTKTRYSFGDQESQLGTYAWYASNAGQTTHPVGQKQPNAFGLYDMHGNVYEWCFDVYDESVYGKRSGTTLDPLVTSGSGTRCTRGGSLNLDASYARAANRGWLAPDGRNYGVSLRVVR